MSAEAPVINNFNYGSDPIAVKCFNCKQSVTTQTTESTSALCCFLFGCWAMCCPGCQDVEHRCPQCNVILGSFKPSC